jgi:hypothetical protein
MLGAQLDRQRLGLTDVRGTSPRTAHLMPTDVIVHSPPILPMLKVQIGDETLSGRVSTGLAMPGPTCVVCQAEVRDCLPHALSVIVGSSNGGGNRVV